MYDFKELDKKIAILQTEYKVYKDLELKVGEVVSNQKHTYYIVQDSPKGQEDVLIEDMFSDIITRRWVSKAVVMCDMIPYDYDKDKLLW